MKSVKQFLLGNALYFFLLITLSLKGLLFLYQIEPREVSVVYFLITPLLLALILSPSLFLRRKLKITYLFIAATFVSFLYLIDLVYYRYFSAIPSLNSLFLAPQVTGVQESVLGLLRFFDIFLFADLIIASFLLKYQRDYSNWRVNLFPVMVIFVGISSILASDSSTYLPKFLNNAYEAKLVTQRYGVLGNHFIDLGRVLFLREEKLSQEEVNEVLEWTRENVMKKPVENNYTGIAENKRVIMLQVESLQNFVINKKVENQEITPNINKLVKESNYFENNYFLIGLGNTSDSDFVVNTSLYPLADSAASIRYPKANYSAIPKVLGDAGYRTSAYHAFYRDFWNRELLFKNFGYEKYYAKDNYSEGKRVGMGLSDSVFLPETVNYLKSQPEKSFNYLITLSSHFPFSLNDEDKVINLNQANYTPEIYRYYNSIAYADAQIGEFIKLLKEEGLYDDTVLILYGDHRANLGETDTAFSQSSLDLGQNDVKQELALSRVPLLIKIPGVQGKKISEVSSVIDVAPTLLNLLGVEPRGPMFGRDLFGEKEPFFASVSFYRHGLITDGTHYFLEPNKCYSKNLTEVSTDSCKYLVEKRGANFSNSSRLIRHNLFPLL